MSYKVLTRKKRPKIFGDVMGHEAIISSLQKAISSSMVGHAYVFSGTRGIGKTSAARIFAKTLCCENRTPEPNPCLICPSCISIDEGSSLNVMEIDGASHNGVDHVRSLIDGVSYLPSKGKYRVYIIDEVHMLSTSAFNALLKTLEEPPAHAVFILATTEPEKIPATVLSRCQKYNFKLASLATLKEYLKKILAEENISFENENCLEKLISLGQGSFRDTLSLVDQIMSMNSENLITEEILWKSLGVAQSSTLIGLTGDILKGDAEGISNKYKNIISHNVDLKHLSLDVLETFFKLIQGKLEIKTELAQQVDLDAYTSLELFWIYETLMKDLKLSLDSLDPVSSIEISLLKCGIRREFFDSKKVPSSVKMKKTENRQPVTQPVAKPAVQPDAKPVAQPVAKPVAQPVAKPVAQPDVKPVAQPVAKPAVQPDAKPVAQSIAKPVAQPVAKPVAQPVAKPVTQPAEEKQEEKETHPYPSWSGFIQHAFAKNPAIAANLEQGNLVGEIVTGTDSVVLEVGFPKSGRVFWDYLCDIEVKARLMKLMASYFKKEASQIQLELSLIGTSQTGPSFRTQAQIHAEKDSNRKMKIEDNIKENSMINYAEKIFSSKVERVELSE